MSSPSSHVDLLIVGAGPAGLTAACWAAQYNISTRIIDKKKKRTETGHADGIQSRTLEILQSFGIVDPILKQGIRDVDMSHWVSFEKPKGKFHIDNAELIFQAINHETDRIERCGRYEADSGKHSRFGQILLNQGVVEQVFADHLEKKNIYVERGREAESLHISTNAGHDTNQYAVSVGVKNGDSNEKRETIHARYLIACDGAHSWVRSQFNVSSDAVSEDSTWGVLDIIPITDFPDIRNSCSIDSQPHGSVMTVPRENRLVRFYIQIRDESKEKEAVQHHTRSPQAMIETAEKLMKPYKLTYKYCDWWSNYSIGRRLAKTYRPYERVFLTGDAAHTHSPKGGQGMNVSIQDSYNLLWKVGAVLTNCANPTILETYEAERRPVAKQLMDLDSRLVEAYEKNQSDVSSGIYEIREQTANTAIQALQRISD
ncbi:hypothetical protein N7461_000252 [Penicillium sp. DV-2018c]|nr:hypothetical protein N7461_000252 [Penicillium sp. DV-2018c]